MLLTNTEYRLLPSGLSTPSASTIRVLSKLDHTAHVLAVYALRRESPHAVQDSLLACWLDINETGFAPAGFQILNFKEMSFLLSLQTKLGLAHR